MANKPGPQTQMAREIAEQPAALERTLAELLPLRSQIAALARGRRRLLLVARGSSDNAAIYARYLAEVHAGMPGSLAAPSVATLYAARLDLSDTLAVAVSQSGSTQEIVDTLAWAGTCGAATVAVTNVPDSPLATGADLALITQAGPELAVPATKSYTTQVAALAVVVDALAPAHGSLDAGFAAVPEQAARLLESGPALDEMVERLDDDHARAARLAQAAAGRWPGSVDPAAVRTNIVRIAHDDPARVIDHLAGCGVRAGTVAPRTLRLVTHHDVDDVGTDRAVAAITSSPC